MFESIHCEQWTTLKPQGLTTDAQIDAQIYIKLALANLAVCVGFTQTDFKSQSFIVVALG